MQRPTSTSSTDRSTRTTSDVCPVCHGTGWELYKVSPIFLKDVYGEREEDFANDFAKRCKRCMGIKSDTVDMTGVPDIFREANITKFGFNNYKEDITGIKKIVMSLVDDMNLWITKGKCLYIHSRTAGSGKTFLACCVAKSLMMKHSLRMKFITVPGYIDKVSEGYALARQGIPDSPITIYKTCEILVLDDIGTQLDKPWQNQELFQLINTRMTSNLLTIYTSNMPIENLNVDDRIKSRIYGTTISIHMPEESMRKVNHDSDQAKFLEAIL